MKNLDDDCGRPKFCLHVIYYVFFLTFFCQGSSVVAKRPSAPGQMSGQIPDEVPGQIPPTTLIPEYKEPSIFDVNMKIASYGVKGRLKLNHETVLSFGPDFKKVLEKRDKMYPNLDPNLFTKEEIDQKKATWDRMVHMTVPELINNGGDYRWKEHTVTTTDNYILSTFQIKKKRGCDLGIPVLFMHDFLGTAADWLMVDPEDAIPFYLVDQGFEVWLLNARGNEYSNRHQLYKITNPKYWAFSFHEQGKFDMPAVVQHVQKETETQRETSWETRKISLVGSGMGTTTIYVYLSLFGKDATRNIFSLAALTPTAFLSRTTSPLKSFLPLANDYLPFNKDGPLVPQTLANFLHRAVPELCPFIHIRNVSLCTASGFLRSTDYSNDLSVRVMRRVFGHYPSTTSIRTFLHYIQLVAKPKFKQFNFGQVENFKRYRQLVPPQYNLFNVTVAGISLYGQKDVTVDFRDVEQTIQEVGISTYQAQFMVRDRYTNVDFMYGSTGVHLAKYVVMQSIRYRACNTNGERFEQKLLKPCTKNDYRPLFVKLQNAPSTCKPCGCTNK